jgi:hypothetical protein
MTTADEAKARVLEAQAARDNLEVLRAAKIDKAKKARHEAFRTAGGASSEAARQFNKTCEEIEEWYQLKVPTLDKQLADAKATAAHFAMKNDGTRARDGQVDQPDKDNG